MLIIYHISSSSQCDYVFHTPDQKLFTYRNYYDSYWNPYMVRFEYDQTPHCCIHTCVSLLATAQVSQTYHKLIVGHKGVNIHRTVLYIFLSTCLLSAVIQSLFKHRISFCGYTFCERFLTRTSIPLAVVFFF